MQDINDRTYNEAITQMNQDVAETVREALDHADTLTVKEAVSLVFDDEMGQYYGELIALPSRVLGVLIVAEREEILSHEQMQELYDYVETVGQEYLDKRNLY